MYMPTVGFVCKTTLFVLDQNRKLYFIGGFPEGSINMCITVADADYNISLGNQTVKKMYQKRIGSGVLPVILHVFLQTKPPYTHYIVDMVLNMFKKRPIPLLSTVSFFNIDKIIM